MRRSCEHVEWNLLFIAGESRQFITASVITPGVP
jgi:hypothetical protein